MDERDIRARAIHLERGFGGGVSAAYHHDPLSIVRMWLTVIVMDVRETFTWHVQQIRTIVVTDSKQDIPGIPNPTHTARRSRLH